MTDPTTNAAVRRRYEAGQSLNDGAPKATATDEPANGADTAVAADTGVHIVTPDGTNTVDLSNAEEAGCEVTVVHAAGGANTPAVAFDDADFVGTGPANMTSAGATATVQNTDGTASGWVVVSTGSA
ncbi:MAG: hypothetical protein RI568_13685 [Natronomonas sp.]|uniref:hypothetical protein n=1 Tax=Natronomonas sp. TaxID=2184060 RepID=UPI0028702FE8|nr:hypothetical protein [Natronomonas sp.]MDR9431734.1 hypothetical protein [Natronomonas sp.]